MAMVGETIRDLAGTPPIGDERHVALSISYLHHLKRSNLTIKIIAFAASAILTGAVLLLDRFDLINRTTLGWLGGGFAAFVVGAWAAFVYIFPPGEGGNTQRTVSAESPGGVVAGRDIHARDITIGATPIRREASLSLVDIVVSGADEFPTIEVKVRNNSDEVIFLKIAEITTLGQWDILNPRIVPKAVPVSWTYDVKIPLQGTAKFNISQQVEPNSVDRFAFRAGPDHDSWPFKGLFAYLLRLKLVYNEDNKELITPPVLLHIPPSVEVAAVTYGRPNPGILEENKEAAQDILNKIGDTTIVQHGIVDAIKSWADADLRDLQKQ